MLTQLMLEVLQQSFHRTHGSGRQGAESVIQMPDMLPQDLDIGYLSMPGLDPLQDMPDKR